MADEDSDGPFRGFGGAEHFFKFFDGRIVRTTNLWHQGDIPARFRLLLPDNATLITKEEAYKDSRGLYPKQPVQEYWNDISF